MGLGRQEVYGVHRWIRLSPVLDLLDVCRVFSMGSADSSSCGMAHTRDILIENIIFLDCIIYDLLGGFVDNQDLPL